MDFEWDEAKRASNLLKHGIAFEDAPKIFDSDHIIKTDNRNNYGEIHFQCLGVIKQEIIMMV